MKKLCATIVKWLLILTVVSCLIIGVCLQVIVKQPRFSEKIAAALTTSIGRPVILTGGSSISFCPFGIKLSGLTIKSSSNWSGSDFLQIADFHLQCKLMSLLSGKIELDGITINDFSLNLLSDEQKGDNWSDWSGSSTDATKNENARLNAPITDATAQNNRVNSVDSVSSSANSAPDGANSINNDHNAYTDLSNLRINHLAFNNGIIILKQNNQQRIKLVMKNLTINDIMFDSKSTNPANWPSFLPTMVAQLAFNGSCALDSLVIGDFKLQDITTKLALQNGKITLSELNCNFIDGGKVSLRGNWVINTLPTQLTASWQVSNWQLRNLLPLVPALKQIDGVVDSNGNVTSNFSQPEELIKTLGGSGNLQLSKGVYYGMDIPYKIRQARNLIAKQTLARQAGDKDSGQTTLELMSVQWEGKNGLFNLGTIKADTSDCTLSGTGTINLVNETLAGQLSVQLKHDQSVNVPLNISGRLNNPSLSLDLSQFLKNRVNNLLPKLLNKITNTGTVNSNSSVDNSESSNSSVSSSIQQKLNGLLGK